MPILISRNDHMHISSFHGDLCSSSSQLQVFWAPVEREQRRLLETKFPRWGSHRRDLHPHRRPLPREFQRAPVVVVGSIEIVRIPCHSQAWCLPSPDLIKAHRLLGKREYGVFIPVSLVFSVHFTIRVGFW